MDIYNAYVGYIETLLTFFVVVFIIGAVSLGALLIANAMLTGMSEMTEARATERGFGGRSDDQPSGGHEDNET